MTRIRLSAAAAIAVLLATSVHAERLYWRDTRAAIHLPGSGSANDFLPPAPAPEVEQGPFSVVFGANGSVTFYQPTPTAGAWFSPDGRVWTALGIGTVAHCERLNAAFGAGPGSCPPCDSVADLSVPVCQQP